MRNGRRKWRGWRKARRKGTFILPIVALLFSLSPATNAQSRSSRALRSVDVTATATGWSLELHFEFPARYLQHSPRTPGRSLRIQVDPLDIGDDEVLQGPIRESLPVPRGEPIPLLEIVYDSSIREQPFVELQFDQSLVFRVEQGDGIRSIRIHADVPGRAARAGMEDSRAEQLFVRARNAIRDGDLDLAIALLTRILELPDNEASLETRIDAAELVGVTYERRGQLAHAQAEYETYLEKYPDGHGAARVRQRLDALMTASDTPRRPLRPSTRRRQIEDEQPIERELFGSMAARYFRSESLSDDSGGEFLATNVLTDLDLAGRIEAAEWAIRGDFAGSYDIDVAGEGRSDDARISRLSMLVEDRRHGLTATLGRQRRSDSGVLGRFDGGRITADLGSHITLSALAGLPVEKTSDSKPDTDTILAGTAIDIKDWGIDGLRSQIFVVGQRTASMTDRVAIGGELRFSGERSYSFVYLDYDTIFQSLNTFLASSSYRASHDTDLRLLVERRNSPVLTLKSALQGQLVRDLDELRQLFSEDEIRDLAEDRTAVSWSGTAGVTHRPNQRYQLSGDLTVNYLEGTKTSGGVTGFDDFGPDFGGTLQLIVNDWLVEDGVGSASLRYFEGETYRSAAAIGYSRFRLWDGVRILPRLRWEWRDSEVQGSSSLLRPSLEVDWRFVSLLFNAEAGLEWREPISGSDVFREINYFIETGIRWEF